MKNKLIFSLIFSILVISSFVNAINVHKQILILNTSESNTSLTTTCAIFLGNITINSTNIYLRDITNITGTDNQNRSPILSNISLNVPNSVNDTCIFFGGGIAETITITKEVGGRPLIIQDNIVKYIEKFFGSGNQKLILLIASLTFFFIILILFILFISVKRKINFLSIFHK